MEFLFFILNLFAQQNMTCITQYDNVCEVASFGNDAWAMAVGDQIYIRAGVPFKNELLKHEQCHVQQYREGRLGEDECYAAMLT